MKWNKLITILLLLGFFALLLESERRLTRALTCTAEAYLMAPALKTIKVANFSESLTVWFPQANSDSKTAS